MPARPRPRPRLRRPRLAPVPARRRRRLLAPLAAAAVAASTLAACGGGTSPAADDVGGTPVPGGTLTFASNLAPTCLDPHVTAQDATAMMDRNVVDSLVYQSPDGALHPWLATSWTNSPDLKTFTFKLRTDVKFQDGSTFDAAAVKANFDHIKNPATKSRDAVNLLGPYAGTTVIDPSTVQVTFTKPFAQFLQAASQAFLGIESPASIAAGTAATCAKVVGTGPFTFGTYTPNQSLTLTRNAAYNWAPEGAAHTGPAYLNQITFTFVPDDAVRYGELSSGQADVVSAVPPVDAAAVKADSSLRLLSNPVPGGTYGWYLNTTKAPFNDQRFRLAFREAIPLDQILTSLYFGQYQRAWSPLAPTTPGYDAALANGWSYNPDDANRLLDQLGYTGRDAQGYRTKDGQRLVVHRPFPPSNIIEERDSLAQQIQASLKKVGIDLELDNITQGQYFTVYSAGDYDVFDFSWSGDTPDVLRLFFDSTNIPGPGNINQNAAQVKDPQIDGWLTDANSTLDPAKRQTDYGNVQKLVVDQGYVLPVYVETYLAGTSAKVHGLTFDAEGYPSLYGTWRVG